MGHKFRTNVFTTYSSFGDCNNAKVEIQFAQKMICLGCVSGSAYCYETRKNWGRRNSCVALVRKNEENSICIE